jgi:hypothetical protein
MRTVPVRVDLLLTQSEVKRLESRAAGEVRSVANYVAWVIQQDLVGGRKRRRQPLDGDPREKRSGYSVHLSLTVPERRELEKRGVAERRSRSGYMTRLVLEELGRRAQRRRQPRGEE